MKNSPFTSKNRGAILIVALILAVLSGIAVASYIRLGKTSMQLSNRSFYANAAVNLAETGLEQGMWSLNQSMANNSDAWSGWTINVNRASRTFSGEDYGQNTTGSVTVVVDRYNGIGGVPILYSRARISPPDGAALEKWLKVELRKRGRFVNGLVAKNQIVFNGNNASVDSWNSDPDKNPGTPAVNYGPGVRRDNGTVASVSILVNSVLVNNSDIWGFAATGGAQPQVGNNGSILGADSAVAGYAKVDPRRISTDFTADFDAVQAPTTGVGIPAINGTTVLGTAGVTETYRVPSISLGGNNKTLTLRGDVTLVITATAGQSAISVTGQGGIVLEAGAKVTIYTAGDIKIAGNGLLNTNADPGSCILYGTSTSTTLQDVQIAGNGALKAAAYVPNGDLKINGNGDVMGAFVATDITLVGNAAFHYDEALAELDTGSPYGINKWQELSSAQERSEASSYFPSAN